MLIELQASMKSGCCPYMVRFYGAMFREGDVWICMEVMDSSLDKFYRMCVDLKRTIEEKYLRKIAYCVSISFTVVVVYLFESLWGYSFLILLSLRSSH